MLRFSRRTIGRAALGAVLFADAVTLVALAWTEHGVFWPDEVLQTLEQGHRAAFGYGLVPWEFREGLRSWFLPGVIAVVMKIGAALGLTSGLALARLVKILVALGSASAGLATARVAERLAGTRAMLVAAVLYAACPLVVFFGSRVFSDTVSMPLVAFAALALTPHDAAAADRSARAPLRPVAAGLWLGVASLVRHQNLLLIATACVALAIARRRRELARFGAAAGVVVVLGGLLDWVTWGAPFASLLRYAAFHLKTRGAGWGEEPASYYATTYLHAMGWIAAALLALFVVRFLRARTIGGLALAYVSAHVLIKHKEARFLLPVLPIVIAMAAAGAAMLATRALRRWRWAAAFALAALSGAYAVTGVARLARATFASLGDAEFGDRSAWHADENATRLFSRAGLRDDICGLVYGGSSGNDWGHTGTYAYLHRDVPMYHSNDGSRAMHANYIVAPRGARVPVGFVEVETEDTYALYRRTGGCLAPPDGYSRDSER